jgi:hypothetical protein
MLYCTIIILMDKTDTSAERWPATQEQNNTRKWCWLLGGSSKNSLYKIKLKYLRVNYPKSYQIETIL